MVSAAFFLTVWLSPTVLGSDAVSVAFMLVFVEFLLMHGSGILGAQTARGSAGCLALIALGGGYLLFFLVAAVRFDSIWPLCAFAWLLVGKLLSGGARTYDVTERQHWNQGIWMLSFLAWLGLVLLIAVLPVPRLGMEPEIMRQVDVSAVSGYLVDHPQKLMAFGTAYYLILSAAKLKGFNVLEYFSSRGGER